MWQSGDLLAGSTVLDEFLDIRYRRARKASTLIGTPTSDDTSVNIPADGEPRYGLNGTMLASGLRQRHHRQRGTLGAL